jgi:hypothetical protein
MRRFSHPIAVVAGVAVIASLAVVGTATAGKPGAAPGQGKIQCSAGGGGVCTILTSGAKGFATLDTTAGGAAAVFIPGYNDSFYGVRLSQVKALSFTYSGVVGEGAPDPHQVIPIDTSSPQDGFTDIFAFVSASTCNNGNGLVDIINDTTCTIYRSDDALAAYPNWAAFVAALGTNNWIALNDYFTFVIADSSQGFWTVGNLTVGKPGK